MVHRVVVIGGGGFGREVLELVEDINVAGQVERIEVVGVLDDGSPDLSLLDELGTTHLGGVGDLVSLGRDVDHVIAIGACGPRASIDRRCRSWDRRAAVLVHPSAVVGRRSTVLGPGTVVMANSTITTHVRLGRHVHVNPNCSIGHDVEVGDHVTLTPQVSLAGGVRIEDRAFLGAGARVLPSIVIGQDSLVGAGAVVVSSVAGGSTVVGVPAVPLRPR